MAQQEKALNDLDYCFRALAQAVFAEDEMVCFRRTFVGFGKNDRSKVLVRCANMAVEEGGTVAATAKAMMIYPAAKWLLKAKRVEDVLEALPQQARQGKFGRLLGLQSVLVQMNGEKPELRLQMRQQFFENCQEFVDTILCATTEGVYLKAGRKNVSSARLAMLLLGEADGLFEDDPISPYVIKAHYRGVIQAVAEHSGEKIQRLLEGLMPDTGPKTAELAVLYHNTELLLREYARIVANYGEETERLVVNMDVVASRYAERQCEQAAVVAEYIKLVRGAVEMVADFPGDNKDLYTVLCVLVSDGDGTKTDTELARRALVSGPTFSRQKYRALALLGAVLWGCDANVLIDMLL